MKSFRLEMLRAARSGRNRLPEAGRALRAFLSGQRGGDGGFVNRHGQADLYYTAFGLMCWQAFDAPADEATRRYLFSFDPSQLDLVHLSCWARSLALIDASGDGDLPKAAMDRLAQLQPIAQRPAFSPYDAFLALGIVQDLCGTATAACCERAAVLAAVQSCRCRGGGYGGKGLAMPLVSLTSAVLVAQWALDQPIAPEDSRWLLNQCRAGGFASSPLAKGPDLLSTAVALLALACCGADMAGIVNDCRRYVESLYDGAAFHPTADDPHTDCEYALYGMMALA